MKTEGGEAFLYKNICKKMKIRIFIGFSSRFKENGGLYISIGEILRYHMGIDKLR